jgi:hypothetical protein
MQEIRFVLLNLKLTPFFMDAAAALYALKNPALRTHWLMMHYLKCFLHIHIRTEDMTADLLQEAVCSESLGGAN